jgi:hypothetical protein
VQVEHILSEKAILSTVAHPFLVRMVAHFQGGYCYHLAGRISGELERIDSLVYLRVSSGWAPGLLCQLLTH